MKITTDDEWQGISQSTGEEKTGEESVIFKMERARE